MLSVWLVCAGAAPGALLRVEVEERSDVLGGRPFGASGAYERIQARAYFAVDPKAPANRAIADIGLAPRNDEGLVEFSADLYVLKPRDPRTGNGALLFEVSNRGGKGMLGIFDFAAGSRDPRSEKELGDGYLLEKGYTLVWLGWQFDVARQPGILRLYTPPAQGVTGLVRCEIVVDKAETRASLADRDHIPYPAANPDDPALTLTVRDTVTGPRQTVPRRDWRIEDRVRIAMEKGFQPGRLYELVYRSQDPALAGLGPAAVRDLIGFLKYGGNGVTLLGDQSRYLKRAYGYGASQSGRFLRTFLYYGFNQDEKSRPVFDGLLVHIAGAGRGSFNHRFAQPSRSAYPFADTFYPTDLFPFSDEAQQDPETGLTDGLVTHATPAAARPKIFYTNSTHEYWGRVASLIHTSVDGVRDLEIPAGTRIYCFAGGQHGPAAFPPPRNGTQNRSNPNPWTISMRALLAAMDAWVRDGREPPPSQYPTIRSGQAVAPDAVRFPKIPGVQFPARPLRAWRADYGQQFRTGGIITVEPPRLGSAFPVLVPQVDADGNETSGVRTPMLQWPLGTFTGWNLRAPEIGAPEELFRLQGSWIPFTRTKAERERTGDPRPSIAERYSTRAEYLEKVGAAARRMVEAGFLLDRDVAREVEVAAREWDWLIAR